MNTNPFIPTALKFTINTIFSYQAIFQKDWLAIAKYKFKVA
jgi:hypothetical protein